MFQTEDELKEGSSRGRRRYCESYRATLVESKSKNMLEVSEIEPLSKETFLVSLYTATHTHTHLLQQLTSNRLLTRTNDPISLLHSEPGDDVVQLISWLMY